MTYGDDVDDDLDDDRPGITRWVQYEMPVFVRVVADADGEDPTIDEVRVAVENIYLARGHKGHPVVYEGFAKQTDNPRRFGASVLVNVGVDHAPPRPGCGCCSHL